MISEYNCDHLLEGYEGLFRERGFVVATFFNGLLVGPCGAFLLIGTTLLGAPAFLHKVSSNESLLLKSATG